MHVQSLANVLFLALPLLTAAAPGRYDSSYQLRARDAEYYAERAIEAREALLEATIENEVQRRVDEALVERDADAEPEAAAAAAAEADAEPEPAPSPAADGGNKAAAVEARAADEPEVTMEKRQESRLWRRRGGTWGRQLARDL